MNAATSSDQIALIAATDSPAPHPHAPWKRGTNENTVGLLRHYLPRISDLSTHTQADLDDIVARLNAGPRKRLGRLTEVFNQLALQ